jgi:hypothetical protein
MIVPGSGDFAKGAMPSSPVCTADLSTNQSEEMKAYRNRSAH